MSIDKQSIIGNAVAAVFEGLEGRRLMATGWVNQNTLTIMGNDASDDVRVALSNDGSELWTVINGATSQRYNAQMIYAIHVDVGNGNNRVGIDPRITTNATVITGKGNDVVYTGAGNDVIKTGSGKDLVNAGLGNDSIESGTGNDKLNGGGGNDYVAAGSGNDSVSADGGLDRLFGSKGNDKFVADRDDVVDAGSGRNSVTKVSGFKVVDVIPSPQIRQLDLIDTSTGKTLIADLRDGATLDLSKLPSTITIVARAGRDVQSVYYSMSDGSLDTVDSSSLLAMTYVQNDKANAWSPRAGTFKLTVTPFAADNARGFMGDPKIVNFTVLAKTPTNTGGDTKPGGNTNNGGTTGSSTSGDALAPKISLVASTVTVQAGQTVHFDATGTTIPGYQIEDAKFNWDFGDAGSRHNTLAGFNSAHVFERTGSFVVRLTVTAPGGRVSTSTVNVTVTAQTISKTIYVSANGNDNNDGLAATSSVRSLSRAIQLASNDSQILFKRGDSFYANSMVTISGKNIRLGTYGSGQQPKIIWNGTRQGRPVLFYVTSTAENFTASGITFDSIYNGDTEQAGMVNMFHIGGKNTTIRDNTFLNVGVAMNLNLQPTQVLVMDNSAPSETGIRDYFVWTEGRDIVIVGNDVANSTREHIVRMGGPERVAVYGNTFANLDRRNLGDPRDIAKGTVVSQKGKYSYVANNDLRGPVGVGPLAGPDGLHEKWARFKHAAVEGNVIHDASFFFQHGAENVTLRDNTFLSSDMPQVVIKGYDTTYQRGVVDAVIDHNLGVNNGTTGNFLNIEGAADAITLTNNVYVAPYLQPGSWGTVAVAVAMPDLSAFRQINGNVWPATGRGYLSSTMMFVGTAYTPENHLDPTRWNSMAQVGNDQFIDVRLDGAGLLTTSMLVRV